MRRWYSLGGGVHVRVVVVNRGGGVDSYVFVPRKFIHDAVCEGS